MIRTVRYRAAHAPRYRALVSRLWPRPVDLCAVALRELGGPGSGHFGHEGRPGQIGGSVPGESTLKRKAKYKAWKDRQRMIDEHPSQMNPASVAHELALRAGRKERARLRKEQKANEAKLGPQNPAVQATQPAQGPELPQALAEPEQPAPQPDPDATGWAPTEMKMGSSDQKEISHLGGGVNKSYELVLQDGTRGVFKPQTDGMSRFGGGWMRGGIYGQSVEREVAAWEIAKLGGVDHLVQPTIERTATTPDGQTQSGSFQLWAEDSKNAARANDPWDGHRDRQSAAMFDYVTGNQDRHVQNWMVTSNGELKLIDHGLILGETRAESPKFNQQFIAKVAREDERYQAAPYRRPQDWRTPKEVAAPYVRNRERIRERLERLGIPKAAIDRTMRRIAKADAASSWKRLYGDGF